MKLTLFPLGLSTSLRDHRGDRRVYGNLTPIWRSRDTASSYLHNLTQV